jgi:tRNA threonylcarbamoyladenosine biosynthesis protein TsaE
VSYPRGVIREHRLSSPEATEEAGARLAGLLRAGDAIGLVGDLGAGKTLLVRGLARGLAVPPEVRVTSPTFTLINEYQGGRLPLFHADLYRLERAAELDELGFEELFARGGVVVVEWSDRFPLLPADRLDVELTVTGDDERTLAATGAGPRGRDLAAAWAQALAGWREPCFGREG